MNVGSVGNLVQLWVQFIPDNGIGGTECTPYVTEHPDSHSGKREFKSLMKFRVSNSGMKIVISGLMVSVTLKDTIRE
ncbi:hypothetical protein Tco_1446309 [Tanacetum coccineum]